MNYVPIRLSTLKPGRLFNFNVYVKLKVSGKYLLYIRNGDDINKDRYGNLKKKKVRQLFIEDSDEEKYQTFLDDMLNNAANDPNLNSGEKADIAGGVANAAIEDMFEDPESRACFENTERAALGIVNIVASSDDVLKELLARTHESEGDIHFRHLVNVSSLAACMAVEMGLSDEEKVNMGVAGMLMDIGKSKLTPEQHVWFEKDPSELDREDFKIYREHPQTGADLLQDKDYVNEEILHLILNHEENKTGQGFPRGETKIDKKTEILGLCISYDRRVTFKEMSHTEALKDITVEELGNFELENINLLKKVLKKQGLS